MKRKRISLILIVAIIAVLGGIGFLCYINRTPYPTISESTFYPAIYKEFQMEQRNSGGQVSESKELSLWWIGKDSLNINNDNSSGVILNSAPCSAVSGPNFRAIAQDIGSNIDAIMKQKGFKINSQNSSKSIDDEQFYDYIQAYEKGTTKAVFVADPDCGSSLKDKTMRYTYTFMFTDNFDNNYQEQSKYLKDLGYKNNTVRVINKLGDFAFLEVRWRRTGGYTVAKLINEKWVKITGGQEEPSCEIINRYKIPHQLGRLVEKCWDSSEKLIDNPN